MAEIVVLGGCIIDLVSYAPRFPKPGETMAGTKFCKGFGGKGANQCVMASRLGTKTALIAKLGSDSFGLEYLQNIRNCDIISDFVTICDEAQTSTAGICVTDEGQNSIVYVPGAVMKLTSDDVRKAESTIANAKVLLCTYESPLSALMEALSIAKKYNVLTVVNAAPAAGASYESLYPLIDIICLNEIEAEDATGINISCIEDAGRAVRVLLDKGCSTVILTLGSNGAVFQRGKGSELTHVPAQYVTPVDSTGAGDAFMGSLVYFLASFPRMDFKEVMHRSCSIATMSVLKPGTQTSFPFRQELPEHLLLEP